MAKQSRGQRKTVRARHARMEAWQTLDSSRGGKVKSRRRSGWRMH